MSADPAGPAQLEAALRARGLCFRIVGSVDRGVPEPRDLDVLVDRSAESAATLSAILDGIAIGEYRSPLRRWGLGVFASPVTIATVFGPLDVWGGDHEAG